MRRRERGRERGREGGREEERKGGRGGGREEEREGGREGGRKEERKRGGRSVHVKTIATGSYQQSCRPGIYCTHQHLLIVYPLKGRNRWEN